MPEPSAWVDFPTKYKFIGVDILLDFTFKSINRSTYSVLDFFGDVGGFNGAMVLLPTYLMSYFTSMMYKWAITEELPIKKKENAPTQNSLQAKML